MPKVLLYITAKIMWLFLFYNKDFNENRAHVHIGGDIPRQIAASVAKLQGR